METKEQVLDAIRLELAKWQYHAVRGMRSGNTAYHQGRLAMITDLFAFIHELDSNEGNEAQGYGAIMRARIEPVEDEGQPDEGQPRVYQVCIGVSDTLLRLVADGRIEVASLRIPIERVLRREVGRIMKSNLLQDHGNARGDDSGKDA